MPGKSILLAVTALLGLISTHGNAQTMQVFQWPVYGANANHIIQGQTYGTYPPAGAKWHTGWDIGSPDGTASPIRASSYGRIWKIVPNVIPGDHYEGNSVIILHYVPNGAGGIMKIFTQYSHLASFTPGIYVGQYVNPGQIIGTMGGSGHGSPTFYSRHLHFEVKYDGVAGGQLQNPWYYPSNSTAPYWGYSPSYYRNYGWETIGTVMGRWYAIKQN